MLEFLRISTYAFKLAYTRPTRVSSRYLMQPGIFSNGQATFNYDRHSKLTRRDRLGTQPPGPVIIMAHSMGGLLAAEAATDISNNPNLFPGAPPRRIVGIIAFDTPFLGMHPHVVVSGLASLLPKKDEAKMEAKLEHDLNENPNVHIVDHRVTDDWEEFKRAHHGEHLAPSVWPLHHRPTPSRSTSAGLHLGKLRLLCVFTLHERIRWPQSRFIYPLSSTFPDSASRSGLCLHRHGRFSSRCSVDPQTCRRALYSRQTMDRRTVPIRILHV